MAASRWAGLTVLVLTSLAVVGGGATASSSRSRAPQRPTAIAISAQPGDTAVVYQAEVTPTGTATNYNWSLGPNPQGHLATCGVFKSTGSVATWTLHDKSAGATCPDNTTAAGSITLTFTFGRYHCTAVDTAGSAGGKYRYNPNQACKLVSR